MCTCTDWQCSGASPNMSTAPFSFTLKNQRQLALNSAKWHFRADFAPFSWKKMTKLRWKRWTFQSCADLALIGRHGQILGFLINLNWKKTKKRLFFSARIRAEIKMGKKPQKIPALINAETFYGHQRFGADSAQWRWFSAIGADPRWKNHETFPKINIFFELCTKNVKDWWHESLQKTKKHFVIFVNDWKKLYY